MQVVVLVQTSLRLQVLSGGMLQATPHFVQGAQGPDSHGIARNTFAVFMQPRCLPPAGRLSISLIGCMPAIDTHTFHPCSSAFRPASCPGQAQGAKVVQCETCGQQVLSGSS